MKMIVCVSENYAIGKDGNLLFSIPEDMKFFRSNTLNKVCIMGRANLDSFPGGKPLKNRCNIVLTHDKSFEREGATALNSPEEILSYIKKFPSDDVYVIGGEAIYKMFEPYCDEALVTKVRKIQEGDKFFFNIDESPSWYLAEESEVKEHEGIKFTFCKYKKR